MVKLHGGAIQVRSSPTEGTEFTLRIPSDIATSQAVLESQDHSALQSLLQADILVVDDNSVNRLVAQKMLQKRVKSIQLADSGPAAIAACENTAYDLILMDWSMPEMDGLEATKHIRAHSVLNKKTCILCFTAHEETEASKRECLAAGMNGMIMKPLKVDKLLERISEMKCEFLSEKSSHK